MSVGGELSTQGVVADDGSSLRDLVGAVRRQWSFVLLVMAITTAVAYGVTLLQDSVYQGKMSIVAGTNGATTGPELASTGVTQTLSSLIRSDVVSSTVVRSLELPVEPSELTRRLEVVVKPESAVLEVSLRWKDKAQVEPILNKVGSVFTRLVNRDFKVSGAAAGSQVSAPIAFVRVFSPAQVEQKAVLPQPVRTIGIAAVLGLVLGILLAIVRERFDERIRSSSDAEEDFGAPVVGVIPRSPQQIRSEALVMLRLNVAPVLQGGNGDAEARATTVFVTHPLRSSPGGEGYTSDLVATLQGTAETITPVDGKSRPGIPQLVVHEGSLLDAASNGRVQDADIVVVMAQKGRTNRSAARATRTFLERLGVEQFFVVLADSDEIVSSRSYPRVVSHPTEGTLRPAPAAPKSRLS